MIITETTSADLFALLQFVDKKIAEFGVEDSRLFESSTFDHDQQARKDRLVTVKQQIESELSARVAGLMNTE